MFRILFFLIVLMSNETLAQTTTPTSLPEFDKLWDFSKPAETEQKFRDVLRLPEVETDLNYRLELLTQIARTQGLQRQFDDAHKTLDDVQGRLLARSHSDPMRASIRYELERGRVYNSSNLKDKAVPYFQKALELGMQMKEDVLAVDAAHMLGIATTGETSLRWNERAVQMAEVSDNPRAKGWLGALYNNIGWTYHDMGKYDVALDYFERDLAWYQERKLENQTRIAKWSIAKMHRLLGDPAKAYEEQRAILAEIEAKKIDPDGYVFEELGECLIAMDRDEEEWKPYIQKAYELLSKDPWSVANESKKHERLKQLLEIE